MPFNFNHKDRIHSIKNKASQVPVPIQIDFFYHIPDHTPHVM